MKIDRRVFVASGLAAIGSKAFGATGQAGAHLTLHPEQPLNEIPIDYNGFSVETTQLADPAFYHPGNASLVALHQRLSANAVLRIGGQLERVLLVEGECEREAAGHQDGGPRPCRQLHAAALHGDHARGDRQSARLSRRLRMDVHLRIEFRHRFARTRWHARRLMSPRRSGRACGYFQIGNEPDLYKSPHNMLRPAGWDFPDYFKEWSAIVNAVVARVPDAKFGGPDIANAADWIARFAEEARGRSRRAARSAQRPLLRGRASGIARCDDCQFALPAIRGLRSAWASSCRHRARTASHSA